jgi:hypothetical protein
MLNHRRGGIWLLQALCHLVIYWFLVVCGFVSALVAPYFVEGAGVTPNTAH